MPQKPNPQNVPLNVDLIAEVEYPLEERDVNYKLIGPLVFQKVIKKLREVVFGKVLTPHGERLKRRKTIRREESKKDYPPVIGENDLVKLKVKSDGKVINFYIRLFDIYLIAFQKENGVIWELKDGYQYLYHVQGKHHQLHNSVNYHKISQTKVGRGALKLQFETIYHKKPADLEKQYNEDIHMALQSYMVMICESVRSLTCYKRVYNLLKDDEVVTTTVDMPKEMMDAALNWSTRSKMARSSLDRNCMYPDDIPQRVEDLFNGDQIETIVSQEVYARYAPYYCRKEICVPHIARRRSDSEVDF